MSTATLATVVVCQKCGFHSTTQGAKFCQDCGKPLGGDVLTNHVMGLIKKRDAYQAKGTNPPTTIRGRTLTPAETKKIGEMSRRHAEVLTTTIKALSDLMAANGRPFDGGEDENEEDESSEDEI